MSEHRRARFGQAIVALVIPALAIGGCGEDGGSAATSGGQDAGAETSESNGQCAECAKDSDCGDGLTCDKPAFVCKTPAQVKVGAPVCDVDCADIGLCKEKGLCAIQGKECVAKILAHCVASDLCASEGKCSVVDERCKVTSDGDCQQSSLCKVDGLCTHKDGACTKTDGVKCGDGKCEGNETKQTCPDDCGKVGGDPCPCDNSCGIKAGCPNDCGGCSGGKWCFANQCTDAKCKLPDAWPKTVQRISKLVLLNHKGGCDLDDSGKVNNMLGNLLKVYTGVNEHAFNALQSHELNLVLHSDDYHAGGKAFTVTLLDAALDGKVVACNPDHAPCKYHVNAHSYDVVAQAATCPAVTQVSGAKVVDKKLTIGGKGNSLDLVVHVVGVPLVAKLQDVSMTGTVSGGSEWQSTKSGLICGAMAMKDLKAAVDSLPESALKGTGFDKKKVNELVNGLFSADIDLDGDGTFDAMSAAWSFETHTAEAIGVK